MTLPLYTVYDHPSDYPDSVVVRKFILDQPTSEVYCFRDLAAARAGIRHLHPGAVCLTRSPQDDPVIVETWL